MICGKKGGTVNCAHSKDLGQINVLVGRSQPSTSWAWAPCLLSFCLLRDCQIIRNNLKSALEYACWLDDMSGMRRMPQQLCKERFAQILVALKRQPYIYQSYGIPVLTILQIVRSFFTQMSHPENEERNKYKFSFFLCSGQNIGQYSFNLWSTSAFEDWDDPLSSTWWWQPPNYLNMSQTFQKYWPVGVAIKLFLLLWYNITVFISLRWTLVTVSQKYQHQIKNQKRLKCNQLP